MNAKHKFYRPSKSVLTKIFPEYKTAIEDYVRRWPVNFFREGDLMQLIQFCNGLRSIPDGYVQAMVVKANERASLALNDSMFRFPAFQDGVVAKKDKQQSRYVAGLNYNLISGEMEVIESGDTIRKKNFGFIATVNINGIMYFRKPEGFIEILLCGPVSLGVNLSLSPKSYAS